MQSVGLRQLSLGQGRKGRKRGFTRMSVEELKSGVDAPLSGTKNCMAGVKWRFGRRKDQKSCQGRATWSNTISLTRAAAHTSASRSL